MLQMPSSLSPYPLVATPVVNGGRLAVGLENVQSTAVAFPPVVEASATAALRDDEKTAPDEATAEGQAQHNSDSPVFADDALTPEELETIRKMVVRDREVRAHEAAHAAVGGNLAGGATYTFSIGPDGGRYAVAGEVQIQLRMVPGDPQATLANAEKVKRAALAPAEPSAQDRRVAAAAMRIAQQAQAEIAEQNRGQENTKEDAPSVSAAGQRIINGHLAEPEESAGVIYSAAANYRQQLADSASAAPTIDQHA